jgi:hypothetical protein
MKCNKLFRKLRKLGVGKKILACLFDRSRVFVVATLPSEEGSDAYIRELKHIRRLILKGYTVTVTGLKSEKPSCYWDCPYTGTEKQE